MSPPPVRPHIPQPSDILLHSAPRIVLNLHARQLRRQVHDGAVLQRADCRPRVDVVARHYGRADFCADAVEGAQRVPDEGRFGEGEAVYEDLDG